MKNKKMISAFKAFELKEKSFIQGGYMIVTWVGRDPKGNQICDLIEPGGAEVGCSIPDAGVRVGDKIGK